MKRSLLILLIVFVFLLVPFSASANMAIPDPGDTGSAVSFEKNDSISVLSEVLDITVQGSEAYIVATYKMKNVTDESVTTDSMFLSPNMENALTKVSVGGKDTSFTSQTYYFSYGSGPDVSADGWRYVFLSPSDEEMSDKVDTVTFSMSFEPGQEQDIVVSYLYYLGGYPDYNNNLKFGTINYYLSPAAMWNGFSNLTINLTLDEGMPVLKDSNLDFEKTGKLTYRYVSDTLPENNLYIEIDENAWQSFFSSLRNPYMWLLIVPFLIFIFVIIVVVVVIIAVVKNNKKKASKQQ